MHIDDLSAKALRKALEVKPKHITKSYNYKYKKSNEGVFETILNYGKLRWYRIICWYRLSDRKIIKLGFGAYSDPATYYNPDNKEEFYKIMNEIITKNMVENVVNTL